jgi:hypothetical protein
VTVDADAWKNKQSFRRNLFQSMRQKGTQISTFSPRKLQTAFVGRSKIDEARSQTAGQGDFSGNGVTTPSEKSDVADGVVRSGVEYYQSYYTYPQKMPPELSSDLADHGIMLTRGFMICKLDCTITETRDCP